MNPDTLKALRAIALCNADDQTYEAWYKSIARWYSEKFHTALHLVMDMSDEDVLRVYFEDTFWRLRTGDEKALEKFEELVQDTLVDGHDQTKVEAEQAEEEDDEWYEQELAALDKQLSRQDADIAEKIGVSDQNVNKVDKPNLQEEPTTRFVQGDDDPFPDDEGLD